MPVIFDPLTGLPKRKPPRLNEPLLLPGFGPTPSTGYPPIPPTYEKTPPTGDSEFGNWTKPPIGGSWNIPDLLRQIGEDPLYQQQLSDIGAGRVSDLASRTAARQRALILFGEIPELDPALTGDVGGDITPLTRELAGKATSSGLSTVARLREAKSNLIRDLKATLTARGLLSSGETGYQLGRAEQEGLRSEFDARQKLLDYLGGIQAAFLQAERERQRLQADYASAAAGRIPVPAAPPPGTTPGPAPPTSGIPDWSAGTPNFGTGIISQTAWEPPFYEPGALPQGLRDLIETYSSAHPIPRIPTQPNPQYPFGAGPTSSLSRPKLPFLSGYPR